MEEEEEEQDNKPQQTSFKLLHSRGLPKQCIKLRKVGVSNKKYVKKAVVVVRVKGSQITDNAGSRKLEAAAVVTQGMCGGRPCVTTTLLPPPL